MRSFHLSVVILLFSYFCSIPSITTATANPNDYRRSSLEFLARQNNFNRGFNHRAHAVPGGPYVAYDHSGNDRTSINLNGVRSHSHYFNPRTNRLGTIVSYSWVVTTSNNRLVCSRQKCAVSFSVGTHTVKLSVKDNTGDVASATTVVRVLDGGKPGVRLLYHLNKGWIPNFFNPNDRAPFSQTTNNIAFFGKSSFSKRSLDKPLSVRLFAEVDISTRGSYVFQLDCGSVQCAVVFSGQLALSSGQGIRTFTRFLDTKPYQFQIVWRSGAPNPGSPKLILRWMKPNTQNFVQVRTDSTLTIFGSGFVKGVTVKIGQNTCKGIKATTQYKLTCAVNARPGTTNSVVVINTKGLRSNAVPLYIIDQQVANGGNSGNRGNTNAGSGQAGRRGIGYNQQFKFDSKLIQHNGKEWKIAQPTSVVRGPDDRFYFATMSGAIFVTEIQGNSVRIICRSPDLNGRSILGLAFNPADKQFKLYGTSSIINFGEKGISKSTGWRNGEIVMLEQVNGCVRKTKTVISGLPVSAFDHAANKLAFDNNGNLYITIGSNTNAGVKHPKTFNLGDSRLSAAVLIANLRKPNFNGNIQYNNGGDPETARKRSGDVSVYATGLRNSFGLHYHSSGSLFATDNGGNQAYGKKSTGCSRETFAQNEIDKLLRLKRGAFYGAANRARGGRECKHYSARAGAPMAGDYQKYIATMEAATTGITEYTANTFGGGLRGNLLLSQIAMNRGSGKVYRTTFNPNGSVNRHYIFQNAGGVDIAITGDGSLVMPRVYQNKVTLLKARERDPGIMVVTSVWPFRGPKSGGNFVHITGWRLIGDIVITVGGKRCTDVKKIGSEGRKVTCKAPSGTGKVAVIARSGESSSGTHGFEYMYMNVG